MLHWFNHDHSQHLLSSATAEHKPQGIHLREYGGLGVFVQFGLAERLRGHPGPAAVLPAKPLGSKVQRAQERAGERRMNGAGTVR